VFNLEQKINKITRMYVGYMKYKVSIIVLILILFSFYKPVLSIQNISNNRNLKDENIRITSDSDFLNFDFPGSGTEEDPYIIENYTLVGIQGQGGGIYISKTTKYLIIRNCTIKNFARGIDLNNCQKRTVKIESNTISNCKDFGIYVINTDNSIIENNWCEYCGLSGIRTEDSSNTIFNGNVLYLNEEGISIYTSNNNVLTNNTLIKNNRWGIDLIWGCNINSINYNYFLANVNIQAVSEGTQNNWNNNYWSDWDGTGGYDKIRGENAQDLSPLICKDKDKDELVDPIEFFLHTNSNNNDTDSDSLSDGKEILVWYTDPLDSDTDGDGLTDGEEVNIYSTDPNDSDTDKDGLKDSLEINTYNTNPTSKDTDGDGLTDSEEVHTYVTDPLSSDTDSDGLTDGVTVMA